MNAMTQIKAGEHRCQEASTLSTDKYIPCNSPARKVVVADGAETRMCDACAWHSEKNRGMKVVRDYGTAEGELILPNIGDNNPPDPIDEVLAAYADVIQEAEAWLDGAEVDDEGQMKAVDALTKEIKSALKDATAAEKSAAAPLHDAWKAEKARWKPTLDDLARIRDGLVSAVSKFKAKLAEEKRAAERAAWEAADKARREAEAKAAQAATTDINAQREAEAAKMAATEATKAAQAQTKDTVKGMRKVTRYEITSHKDALHDIAATDRDAMTAFIEEYVRRNHKSRTIAGVRVWEEKEAF